MPRRYLHDHSHGMEALLRTIRFAEGTWRGGTEAGYQVIYGGRLISEVIPGSNPFSKHPEFVVVKQNALNSSAAGAYQFMGKTWNKVAGWLRIEDFSPPRARSGGPLAGSQPPQRCGRSQHRQGRPHP